MAITNKEILEAVEILKSQMPNGNIALLQQAIEDLQKSNNGVKLSMRELKKQLLDPDDGVVVRVNKNSEFRRESEQRGPMCQKSFEEMEDKVEDLTIWKTNVTKFVWIMLTTMVGLISKVIYDMVGK